jgi:hypothetical protein
MLHGQSISNYGTYVPQSGISNCGTGAPQLARWRCLSTVGHMSHSLNSAVMRWSGEQSISSCCSCNRKRGKWNFTYISNLVPKEFQHEIDSVTLDDFLLVQLQDEGHQDQDRRKQVQDFFSSRRTRSNYIGVDEHVRLGEKSGNTLHAITVPST